MYKKLKAITNSGVMRVRPAEVSIIKYHYIMRPKHASIGAFLRYCQTIRLTKSPRQTGKGFPFRQDYFLAKAYLVNMDIAGTPNPLADFVRLSNDSNIAGTLHSEISRFTGKQIYIAGTPQRYIS